ncbi:glyoxalase family protein [Aeromonas hydrophila]|uniref:VOC family protein n=1 Tax=Aeromonas hydrophila TaxID=644 RepID=UPI0011164AF4|nr:VOC family protein [Aeromonas hydrophila]MBC6485973.1 glyoxalase [Aeromonas hydrophila]MCP3324848.1 VOC family protein [Aeromonas hydrophila]TNH81740.1 glyoxalase family protein [Aeromonas hydrophila]
MTKAHEKLNYVEFAARDLAATKAFFQAAFGWQFADYGPDYCAFEGEGLDGGFYRADIEATQSKVAGAGGTIVRPLFDFPGGRRFHFVEPSGNEFAVWSEPANA